MAFINRKLTRFAAGLAALLLISGLALAGEFPDSYFYYAGKPRQEKLEKIVGKEMPKIESTEWINGKKTAADLKGKIVVVDLWATWCKPCIASIPHNNKIAKDYSDKGVVVVGICTAGGQEHLEDVVEKHEIKYSVCKDPREKMSAAWGLQFYPTYAVVDKAGKVRAIGLRPDKVEKVIEVLLKEEPAKTEGKKEEKKEETKEEKKEAKTAK